MPACPSPKANKSFRKRHFLASLPNRRSAPTHCGNDFPSYTDKLTEKESKTVGALCALEFLPLAYRAWRSLLQFSPPHSSSTRSSRESPLPQTWASGASRHPQNHLELLRVNQADPRRKIIQARS